MIRRQPPVYSPLPAGALTRAIGGAWTHGGDAPRDALSRFLADRYDAGRVVLLGSGTQALTLAIRLAREQKGGPVALPAFSCFDVATAAVGASAPIVFYDVNPDTLGPDWSTLEAALEAGARVVVLACLYGLPIDWERARSFAERYDATLIEDAAQGIGASWRDRPLGSLGELSVLSFGRGKGWTGGGGGALLVRETAREPARPQPAYPSIASARRETVVATGLLAQWVLGRPALYGLPYRIPWLHLGETRYREPEPLAAIPSLSAAMIFATAQLAEEEARQRRATAALLRQASDLNAALTLLQELEPGMAGYLRMPCRVRDPAERERLLSSLGDVGAAQSYPISLRRLPQIQDWIVGTGPTPGADALADGLITLPTHSLLRPRDLDRLAAGIAGRR